MVGPGPQVSDIKNLFRMQRKGDYEEYSFNRFKVAEKKIEEETGMTRQCEYLMNEGAQFEHAGYYYISLQGKFASNNDISGHAIAAYIDPDGKCRYFNPNVGEYETDTMEEMLAEMGQLVLNYSIRERKIYWCCWK